MLGAIEQGANVRSIRYRTPTMKSVNAIAEELKGFVEAIKTQTPPPVTAAEGTSALRVAERILAEIAVSQQRLTLPELNEQTDNHRTNRAERAYPFCPC